MAGAEGPMQGKPRGDTHESLGGFHLGQFPGFPPQAGRVIVLNLRILAHEHAHEFSGRVKLLLIEFSPLGMGENLGELIIVHLQAQGR